MRYHRDARHAENQRKELEGQSAREVIEDLYSGRRSAANSLDLTGAASASAAQAIDDNFSAGPYPQGTMNEQGVDFGGSDDPETLSLYA